jgi:hypothetical protein
MHAEILNDNQKLLLPFLKKYRNNFYLVGGTAIALHIGHRQSVDFDLFCYKNINFTAIKKDIANAGFSYNIIAALTDQVHFVINGVKLTYYQYPFNIENQDKFDDYFVLPDLITLAAMKAFALGGRGKWKDYVDLYFIIKDFYSAGEIAVKAREIFKDVFNPILFKKQLCYFADINYSEGIEYLPGFETDEQTIKEFLTEAALTGF